MPIIKFTHHLQRFFPTLAPQPVSGQTVADIIQELDRRYPGLAAYIVDEQGSLRKHVNIFVDGELIQDRQTLQDNIVQAEVVYIFQALSGG